METQARIQWGHTGEVQLINYEAAGKKLISAASEYSPRIEAVGRENPLFP